MEYKRPVGRPKLADKNLLKKAILFLIIAFVFVIALVVIGSNMLFGSGYKKLSASATMKSIISSKNLRDGNCPVAPDISSVKDTISKVEVSVNASDLSSDELKKLYVVTKKYNADKKVKYNKNGKSKTEKIGEFNSEKVKLLKNSFDNAGSGIYKKTIETGDYYYIAIYSGKKNCYTNYIVKDGVKLKNYDRKYKIANYNIVTKKGVVRAVATNAVATSSNEKVLKLNSNNNEYSYKATGQNVAVGNGNKEDNTTKITINQGNLTGSFSLVIPSRYYESGYLLNPLTKSNKTIKSQKELKKVSKTKNSKGKKLYGLEIKTKKSKKIYAMDSGTVIKVRNKKSSKDTYGKFILIESKINGVKYIHTYANLKEINVKENDRVYKGKVIGKTKKSYVFISFSLSKKDYYNVLLSNLIGKKMYYGGITSKNYEKYQTCLNEDLNVCGSPKSIKLKLYYNYGTSDSPVKKIVVKNDATFKEQISNYVVLTRKGYNFKGWYTSATGGKKVDDTQTVKEISKSKTISLYAQWEAKKYNISFDANGGEFEDGATLKTDKALYNTYYSLPNLSLKRNGSVLNGWKDENGKVVTGNFLISKNVQLYANWKYSYGAEVYFLNTKSQSQSILFKSVDNKFALLDTANNWDHNNSSDYCANVLDPIKTIIPMENGKHTIEYLFISHWHDDHYGCLNAVLKDSTIKVNNIYIKNAKQMESSSKYESIYNYFYKNDLEKYYTQIKQYPSNLSLGGDSSYAINIKFFNTNDVFKNNKECFYNNSYYIDPIKYSGNPYICDPNNLVKNTVFVNNKYQRYNTTYGTIEKTSDCSNVTQNQNGMYNYYYGYFEKSKPRCSQNANSVALLLEIPTQNGKKYVYLPSDLENNGVTYDGQEVTIGNQKAKVYGNGYTVGYDRSNLSKTKSVVIASESIVANQIKNYITSNNGSLNDIILYQASHHASNVDSYAINTLNLNRGNLYVVAPTSGDVGDDYKLAQHLIFYKLLRNNSSNKHFTTTSYLATKNTIYSEKAVVFTINHEGKIDGSNNNYITTCTNKACDYE